MRDDQTAKSKGPTVAVNIYSVVNWDCLKEAFHVQFPEWSSVRSISNKKMETILKVSETKRRSIKETFEKRMGLVSCSTNC